MIFKREEIIELSQAVCGMMLDLPADAVEPVATADDARLTTAFTRVSGPWNGVVALACPGRVASLAAAAMFGKPHEQVTGEDRHDAVLELSNVLGGNIKAMLPETCRLSLPQTLDRGDLATAFPSGRLLMSVDVPTRDCQITVTVLQTAA